MPLESGTKISNLNKDYPLSTDQVSQGDDHLKLIKEVLKESFPSDVDVQIPDMAGHGGETLIVNDGGTAIEWGVAGGSPINRFINRSIIRTDGTKIYASPGSYYILNNDAFTTWTTEQEVTVPTASGDQWVYVYINSTSGELEGSHDTPVESITSVWESGDNRCIGAVFQQSDGTLRVQYHDGGDYIQLNADITHLSDTTGTGSWESLTVDGLPSFVDDGCVEFGFEPQSHPHETNGTQWSCSTDGVGSIILGTTEGGGGDYNNSHISISKKLYMKGKTIFWKGSRASTGKIYIRSNGYYLPKGL